MGQGLTEKLFALYSACFPDNVRAEETVRRILGWPDNACLVRAQGERLLAASLISGNTVLMLCVLPGYRRQGIGSQLLEESEGLVRSQGFSQIQFCDGPDYLLPGIPLTADNAAFFPKRGYVHSWGGCECVDMRLSLRDWQAGEAGAGDSLDGVVYRFAQERDRERVAACVRSAYPPFAGYYQDSRLYTGQGRERVLMAEREGLVCGTLLVGSETGREDTGSVGCTVTRTEYRGRGIATQMVRLGTGYLKSLGLSQAFLGYTYTDIIPLYERSGYRVCQRYLMAKKPLPPAADVPAR